MTSETYIDELENGRIDLSKPNNPEKENLETEKRGITEILIKPEKKKYTYESIQLTLNPKRRDVLEKACATLNLDVRRIDHHDQELIWEILGFIDEACKVRAWADLHFGEIIKYGKK